MSLLCPGDESSTSVERQIKALMLHNFTPPTQTEQRKKNKLTQTVLATQPVLRWQRISTKPQWCIKDTPRSCIFHCNLEASHSLQCKTVGHWLHTDVLLILKPPLLKNKRSTQVRIWSSQQLPCSQINGKTDKQEVCYGLQSLWHEFASHIYFITKHPHPCSLLRWTDEQQHFAQYISPVNITT